MYACHEPAATTKITANFKPNVSLPELAAWVTGFTCKNIVFSSDAEKAGQTITILAPQPMTPKQAQQLFIDSLDTIGLIATVKGNTITIKLGPKAVSRCVVSAPTDPIREPSKRDPSPDTLEIIAKGVGEIDATHYTLTAELVDHVLADPMEFSKSARVVPSAKGMKLYALRPGSLFVKLGFLNGDTINSINGYEIASADKALEAYTKIRDAKTLDVVIVRRGKELTLHYTIQR